MHWMRALLTISLLAGPVAAQTPDSGAFIVRLGNDTLVLERFVRTGDRVRAEALVRSPATVLRRYELRLNQHGGIRRFEAVELTPADHIVTRREQLIVVGDTAVQLVSLGDSTVERRFVVPVTDRKGRDWAWIWTILPSKARFREILLTGCGNRRGRMESYCGF